MRFDRTERAQAHELEKLKIEKNAEMDKLRCEAETQKETEKLRLLVEAKKQIEIEAQKAEAQKETERLRLEAETKKAEAQAKKAEVAAQKETEKIKLEAQAERDRREFELEKNRMEHEFRMRNLGNAEQGGGEADREQDSQNGRAARMKALKLLRFNEQKDYYYERVLRAICCQPVDGSLICFM